MSKTMKILLGAAGGLALVAVVLTMFGLPPNLPLGPLQGMLAGEEEPVVASEDPLATDPNLAGAGLNQVECDPATGLPIDPNAAAGATTPGSGTGAADPAAGAAGGTGAVDPATGLPTDAAATGAVDPATGAAGGAGTGAVDPATGAPIAAGADGWDGSSRVVAASSGVDVTMVSDSRIVAAEAIEPISAPIDPAAPGAADPAATGAADPAATGGAVDPNAAAGTAGGAGAAGTTFDPCADVGAAGSNAQAGGVGAGAAGVGAGAGAGAGAAAAAGGTTTVNASTTDGTNTGNNPEALRAAADATGVMTKAKIQVTTTATLMPATGGVGKPAQLKRYRTRVTGAVLVMKLDAAAMQQWTGAGKKVQTDLVKSFLARLRKSYRAASRSVTIVDASSNVLATGDASASGGAVVVKLL